MNRRTIIALSVLGVMLTGLLALQTPLLSRARGFIWSIWVGGLARVFSIGPLQIDNDTLTQMHVLQSDNIHLKAQLQDYTQLRHEIGQNAFDNFKAIPAAISARPLDTFHSQYILNRGLEDGVVTDAPVVVYGSTMIGFITETHAHSSVVQLLIHPGTAFAAVTIPQDEGSQPARGLLQGQHYISLTLTTIPRDIPISIEEDVVTIAKENTMPAGLVIGKIAKVHNDVNEAYQQADLSFAYDADQLSAVTILVAR